jgi:tRNA 5-methylaminomethyl-2-thiouridine biosynthesis bifunctional protein
MTKPAWAAAGVVLDTDFRHGQHFFQTWANWRQAPGAGRLHYVALCPAAPGLSELALAAGPFWHTVAQPQLESHWFGWLPGFHRVLLEDGRLTLTLCVGESRTLLKELRLHADQVRLNWPTELRHAATDSQALVWWLKSLAQSCRVGTQVQVEHDPRMGTTWRTALPGCGFALTPPAGTSSSDEVFTHDAVFNPRWTPKAGRGAAPLAALPVGRCAVVGAGLAGASVAAALARRGWQVQVLEQAPYPAAGASGLPVGLMVPHTSSDDCVLSRLSRAGVRLMWAQARAHLVEGQDWGATGVMERQIGGTPRLPAAWCSPGTQTGHNWAQAVTPGHPTPSWAMLAPALWHPRAAWVKPAALIAHWLAQPGVQFVGDAAIAQLQHTGSEWLLQDAQGQVRASADCVVLANACGAFEILQTSELSAHIPQGVAAKLTPIQGMRGQLSWISHSASGVGPGAFPAHPVNGSGSVIAGIPSAGGSFWCVGSSYQPAAQPERSEAANHQWNLDHLRVLLPQLAPQLEPLFASGQMQAWHGQRCVPRDRLPLVGALQSGPQPSLWLCAGIGSRGLSFSMLNAELLAAQMNGEPWPIEASLAKALDAQRG